MRRCWVHRLGWLNDTALLIIIMALLTITFTGPLLCSDIIIYLLIKNYQTLKSMRQLLGYCADHIHSKLWADWNHIYSARVLLGKSLTHYHSINPITWVSNTTTIILLLDPNYLLAAVNLCFTSGSALSRSIANSWSFRAHSYDT